MNEKPPHHSWLPSSTFLNAAESHILLQPADTAPNTSPASNLPFLFFYACRCFKSFCFYAKAQSLLASMPGTSFSCLQGGGWPQPPALPERAYLPLTSRALRTEGGREISIIGGKICSVNENGEFCCRNLQASRSPLSWLKPAGLLHKFSCWVLAIGKLPHAGRSAVNPPWLFGQDKKHHYLKKAGQT